METVVRKKRIVKGGVALKSADYSHKRVADDRERMYVQSEIKELEGMLGVKMVDKVLQTRPDKISDKEAIKEKIVHLNNTLDSMRPMEFKNNKHKNSLLKKAREIESYFKNNAIPVHMQRDKRRYREVAFKIIKENTVMKPLKKMYSNIMRSIDPQTPEIGNLEKFRPE